jgi:hypothetical protein
MRSVTQIKIHWSCFNVCDMGLDKDMFNFTSSSQNDCSIIDVFIVLQILDHIAKHCYLIVYICMMPLH